MVAATKAEEEPIFVFLTCKLGSNFRICGVGEWKLIEPLYIEICHYTSLLDRKVNCAGYHELLIWLI